MLISCIYLSLPAHELCNSQKNAQLPILTFQAIWNATGPEKNDPRTQGDIGLLKHVKIALLSNFI
jgi:hypothetical protein